MGLFEKITGLFSSSSRDEAGVSKPAVLPGRNDLCWCGSGRKYKHCHLDKDKPKARPAAACKGST